MRGIVFVGMAWSRAHGLQRSTNLLDNVVVCEKVPLVRRLARDWFGTGEQCDESSPEFCKELLRRRMDPQRLQAASRAHDNIAQNVISSLSDQKIPFVVSDQDSLSVDEATLVIVAGGDGTFLNAASQIPANIPVLGVNTDPVRFILSVASPPTVTKLTRVPSRFVRRVIFVILSLMIAWLDLKHIFNDFSLANTVSFFVSA